MRRIGDLGNDRQTGCLVRLVQQLQTLSLQTLEGVRGRARLPCAAAENGRAVGLHVLGDVDDLLLALDRARACHDDELFAADGNARGDLDDRVVRMELAVCELERLLNLDDVLDLRVEHERILVDRAGITDQTDNDGALAVDRVRLYVPAFDVAGKLVNVLVGRTLLHDNDHFVCLLFVSVDGENAVCPAEKGIKKALHPQRGTKDKQFRGTTHIRRTFCAALFRYRIYPIPVTEETRLRLLGILSARQLKRELHRAGVCIRFQS